MNQVPPHVAKVRLLYKTILQLHRGLPAALQTLGDSYVKSEFKRHKNCSAAETAQFMIEWTKYAVSLANQLGLKDPNTNVELGTDLDANTLELMREDQIVQLYDLLQASKENTAIDT